MREHIYKCRCERADTEIVLQAIVGDNFTEEKRITGEIKSSKAQLEEVT